MGIIEDLRDKIEVFLKEGNYELIDITFRRESGGMTLRLIVDKVGGGITIGECTALNDSIGAMLDENDLIYESYILEVASPGLDRPIVTDRDFERSLGKLIKVYTTEFILDKRLNTGLLKKVEADKITLEKDGKTLEIPREMISKAILEIVF